MSQEVQHIVKSTCQDAHETAVAASLSKEAQFRKRDTGITLAPPEISIPTLKLFPLDPDGEPPSGVSESNAGSDKKAAVADVKEEDLLCIADKVGNASNAAVAESNQGRRAKDTAESTAMGDAQELTDGAASHKELPQREIEVKPTEIDSPSEEADYDVDEGSPSMESKDKALTKNEDMKTDAAKNAAVAKDDAAGKSVAANRSRSKL